MIRSILAILALCLTAFLFLVARRRKRLTYSLSNTPVLGIHEAVNPSRVQILFDGTPVTEVRLAILTVTNVGNEPILVNDFERPLLFVWSEPAKILSAEVTEVNPDSLKPTIRTGVHEIALDPLLLNAGDWLRIKALINQVGKLSVDARVIGVKRITKVFIPSGKATSDKTIRVIAGMGFFATLILLVMWAGQALGLWAENGRAEQRIVGVTILVMLLVMADQLKAATIDLVSYFKNKDDDR